MPLNKINLLSLAFLMLVFLVVGLILFGRTIPEWGERHLAHIDRPSLVFSSGHKISQTFVLTGTGLDRLVIWLDTNVYPLPNKGSLRLTLAVDNVLEREVAVNFSDIPDSGTVIFNIFPPLNNRFGAEGRFSLTIADPGIKTGLQYQKDASIFSEGELIYERSVKSGDLAWQARYQRPSLGNVKIQITLALMAAVAGVTVVWLTAQVAGPITNAKRTKKELLMAAAVGSAVLFFYAASFLRPGIWVGPSDFAKDASYLASASLAIKSLSLPIWSHYTCGGMALLGNPEANILSLGSILAIFLPPDRALLYLIVVESGIGAFGSYLLSRSLGLKPAAAITATAIYTLSAAFSYRILEGFTMMAGVFAYLPLVWLGAVNAQKNAWLRWRRTVWWILFSGFAMGAILLRGDVHVIVGIIVCLAVWFGVSAMQKKSMKPVLVLVLIGLVFTFWSLIKILPYLEQPALIGSSTLKPYVALLFEYGLVDDVFLKSPDRDILIPVKHGTTETFGNIGAYIGLLPLLLLVLGSFVKNKYRWQLLGVLLTAFILAEGTLFDLVLRQIYPLGALLRMPSRIFSLVILFIGLLAGRGVDMLFGLTKQRKIKLMVYVIIIFVIVDLGLVSYRVIARGIRLDSTGITRIYDQPILTPHKNFSDNHEYHATKLLRAGSMLPEICGDQNNPSDFILDLEGPTALATVLARLAPNKIILEAPQGPIDVTINERFNGSWKTNWGEVLPNDDGSIHLVLPQAESQTVILNYTNPNGTAELIIILMFITAIVYLVALIFF